MTSAELASTLGKTSGWIENRLSLNKITNPEISGLIDDGKINLSNAYAMAKLPEEEMKDWIERALTESPGAFVPAVQERIKEIRDSKRKGRDPKPQEFIPVPYMQKVADVKAEMDKPTVGAVILNKHNVSDAGTAWNLAIAWILHMDPESLEVQRAKYEERKAAKDLARQSKKEALQKAKEEEARETAANIE